MSSSGHMTDVGPSSMQCLIVRYIHVETMPSRRHATDESQSYLEIIIECLVLVRNNHLSSIAYHLEDLSTCSMFALKIFGIQNDVELDGLSWLVINTISGKI